MRTTLLAACAALAATGLPALASAQEAGSQADQQCIQDLQAFDRELGTTGFGLTGPGGFGPYGAGTAADAAATAPAPGATTYGYLATPREQMLVLRNAALVLAMQGNHEGCAIVVDQMRSSFEDYRQQVADGEGVDPEEVARWRSEWLAAATPVDEVEGAVQVSDILGTDVRSVRDEDLGDIENVIMNDDGEIEYVTVARGGFLGFGGDTVAIPWESLRVTPDPYRDTFVLPVEADALENAPAIEEDQLASQDWWEDVKTYWDERVQDVREATEDVTE